METNNGQTNQATPRSSGGNQISEVEVTTFEDAQVTPGYEMPMLNNSSSLAEVESTHSIVEFLRRPTLMLDSQIKPGDLTPLPWYPSGPSVPVFTYQLPFSVSKLGGKDQKLARFEYLKTDVVVKLTVNANNMTSGRFWLCYAPIDQFVAEGSKTIYRHRAGVTAYPGVEMDIQINNSIEMRIPYLHWAEAMSITSTRSIEASMATLYLFALTPLRSQGDYPITIQLWGWFDNVTLVGPTTDNPAVKTLSRTFELVSRFKELETSDPKLFETITASMQVGEVKGPISQVASKVSAVAEFAKGIPLVSEVASTVGWVSDLVGGVASIFGWSKPVNAEPVCKLANVPAFGYTHAEGQDGSLVLGLSSKNSLDLPKDVFASGVDEMDIEYVCRNPSLVMSHTWTKTDAIYTELIGTQVGPMADMYIDNANSRTYCTSPCDYVASMFALWRGTMCYRVCLVKTAYHTGRLEISFVPNKFVALTKDDDTTNAYRYILDITNEAEVIIKIPFFSDAKMLPVSYRDGTIGRLTVRPITTLHAPEVVSNTVDVLVWKWMEEPVFGAPVSQDLYPQVIVPSKVPVEMQIHVANTVSSSKTVVFFEGEDKARDKVSILSQVCGEVCDNLRYLTRSTKRVKNMRLPEEGGSIGLTPFGMTNEDYIGYISQMYRYARGGINFKLFAYDQESKPGVRKGIWSQVIFNDKNGRRAPEHITFLDINPVHEISVPFYSKYKCVPVAPLVGLNPGLPYLGEPILPTVRVRQFDVDAPGLSLEVFRGGKDDFSFGVLIGPPMLVGPKPG